MARRSNARRYRHRITLVTPAVSQGNDGHPTADYSLNPDQSISRWAHVEPLNGREGEQASAVFGEVTHRVTMHHTTGIDSTTRVTHNSRTLEVVSVLDKEEEGVELELMCKERGV